MKKTIIIIVLVTCLCMYVVNAYISNADIEWFENPRDSIRWAQYNRTNLASSTLRTFLAINNSPSAAYMVINTSTTGEVGDSNNQQTGIMNFLGTPNTGLTGVNKTLYLNYSCASDVSGNVYLTATNRTEQKDLGGDPIPDTLLQNCGVTTETNITSRLDLYSNGTVYVWNYWNGTSLNGSYNVSKYQNLTFGWLVRKVDNQYEGLLDERLLNELVRDHQTYKVHDCRVHRQE